MPGHVLMADVALFPRSDRLSVTVNRDFAPGKILRVEWILRNASTHPIMCLDRSFPVNCTS